MRIATIIPCYNVALYIRRAVESVWAQTHDDVELICVDDGSTDDTVTILKELHGERPDRLQLIMQTNKGACAARNAGMSAATGEYIQFLDADDELLPEKLAHQAALAAKTGMPDLVIGSSRTFSADGELVRKVVQSTRDRDPWLDLMAHRMNVTSTLLWRTAAVREAHGWNEELRSSQEYDLMFRMLKNGARVVYDDAVLTYIHQRKSGSIGQTNVKTNWERFIALRAAILQHVRDHQLTANERPYLQVLFDSIRTLYPYDRKAALEFHQRLIPADFVPTTSLATGNGYLLLHRLLGFDLANRLRTMLGGRG